MDEKPETRPMGQVIQIDEARIRDHLGEMVRGTVEEALNAMLDAEADLAVRRRPLRAQRGAKGHARRQLDTSKNPRLCALDLGVKEPELGIARFRTGIGGVLRTARASSHAVADRLPSQTMRRML